MCSFSRLPTSGLRHLGFSFSPDTFKFEMKFLICCTSDAVIWKTSDLVFKGSSTVCKSVNILNPIGSNNSTVVTAEVSVFSL